MSKPQVVLITGAASGIGRASALRLLAEGHIVYGGDINYDGMADLEAWGMHRIRWDVTVEQDALDATERVIAEQGRIDAIVANAGYTSFGMLELIDLDEARRQFDVNVIGQAALVKAALPHMRAAGPVGKGRIVFMSSAAGRSAPPGYGWYPVTKHGTEAFADVLRREMKATFPGIGVAVIEPGYTATNLIDGSEATWAKAQQHPQAGAYREVMHNFMANFRAGFRKGADTSTIAELVLSAITDVKPKKRYRCHSDAFAAVMMERFFGDTDFLDKAMAKSMFGAPSAQSLPAPKAAPDAARIGQDRVVVLPDTEQAPTETPART